MMYGLTHIIDVIKLSNTLELRGVNSQMFNYLAAKFTFILLVWVILDTEMLFAGQKLNLLWELTFK